MSHLCHACYMSCPSHPPWFDHITIFDEVYIFWSLSLLHSISWLNWCVKTVKLIICK
jgi:hypothetical protein